MKKKSKYLTLCFGLNFFVLIGQVGWAATYTPANNMKPGSLKFNNILTNDSGSISATLIATDQARPYAGQVYQLNTKKIGAEQGEQDGIYDSSTKKITSKNIQENSNILYDMTLRETGFDSKNTNFVKYTIINFCSKIISSGRAGKMKGQEEGAEKGTKQQKLEKQSAQKESQKPKKQQETNNKLKSEKQREHKRQSSQ